MNLRDEIIGIIDNAALSTDLARTTWYDTRTGEETPAIPDTADKILALVRDAMLRDEAVEAAADEYWDKTPNKDKSMCISAMRLAIIAALDAAGIAGEDTAGE